jgi:hypothetical protein
MNVVLENLKDVACISYIDDVLIFGKTKDEHNENFKKIKKRLAEYDLKENESKRVFCVENVRFLGYDISFNHIKPTSERKQGIFSYKSPRTKKELQRFIGILNYDRLFIKGITEKLKPLYELLVKESLNGVIERNKHFRISRENGKIILC